VSPDPVATLRAEAEGGSASAAFALGNRYARGDGVPKDLESAARWYTSAAQAGMAPAQFNLGVLHEEGEGVKQDPRQALLWYIAAAEQGHQEAQFRLGVLYGSGNGANRDYLQAAKWYRRAALQDHRDAQFNLGLLYDRGVGVPQSDADAYYWMARAATAGDQEALQRQVSVGRRLLAEARAELDRRAAAGEPPPAPAATAPTLAQPAAAAPADADTPALTASGQINPDAVRHAQRLLERLGYDPGPADGLLGAKTVDAIRAFRRDKGLAGGGSFGDDLLASLQATVAKLN
jgi:localization factor PodJL